MLKRLAIALLFVGVLPIYAQQQHPEQNGDLESGKSTTNPAPQPSRAITCEVKQDGTTIECKWPEATPESYFKRFSSPENVPSIGLFFVGVGGIVVGVITLLFIRAQVIEMRRQVTASHDGLRAWIGIEVRENELTAVALTMMDQITGALTHLPPRFEWEIKNYGQTPAFVNSVEVSNVAYSTPKGRLEPGKSLEVNGFLGAGQSDTHILTLPDEGLNKCELHQMFWRVSVKVAYDDAFKREHETMFSFHYFVPQTTSDPRRRGFYQDIDRATNYYN